MSVPHYRLEFTKGTQKKFRFVVEVEDSAIDISGWPEFWFAMKRGYADADEDAIFSYALFAGIEVIDAPTGVVEVTLDPDDAPDLDLATWENFVADVGGIDDSFEPQPLMTLEVTGYPRVRQSNA